MAINESSVSVRVLESYVDRWLLEKVGAGRSQRWMLRYLRGGSWWVLETPATWARSEVLEFAAEYLRVVVGG